MASNRSAPGIGDVAFWSVVLTLLSVSLSYISTETMTLGIGFAWLIPFAGVAIGLRLERLSLLPFLIAAPVLLLNWSISNFTWKATIGGDVFLFACSAGLAVLTAASRRSADKRPPAPIPAWGIALLLIVLAAEVSLYAARNYGDASGGFGTRGTLPAVAAFLLAASGRLTVRSLLWGVAGFGAAILSAWVCVSLIAAIGPEEVGWMSGLASKCVRTISGSISGAPGSSLSAGVGWLWSPSWTISLTLAAGLMGRVLAPFALRRALPGDGMESGTLLTAAVIVVLFGSVALDGAANLFHYYSGVLAGTTPNAVLVKQLADEVIVTASCPNVYVAPLNADSLAVLAGVIACIAARNRRLLTALGTGLLLAIVAATAEMIRPLMDYGWDELVYFLPQAVVNTIAVAVALSIAALLGRRLRRVCTLAAAQQVAYALPADITRLAAAAGEIDVTATLRAFTFLVVILASWSEVISGGLNFLAVRDAFAEDTGGGFEIAFWAALAIGIVAPFGFMLTDRMARSSLQAISASFAILNFALLVMWGFFLLIAVAVFGVGVAVLAGWANIPDADVNNPAEWIRLAIMFVAGAFGSWFALRTIRVERILASPAPRSLLVGTVQPLRWGRHLAYLFGLPSSMWRLRALGQPSSWLFLASRPLVYAAAVVGGLAFEAYDTYSYDGWGYEDSETAYRLSAHAGFFVAAGAALFLGGHLAFAAAKRLAARRIWDAEAEGKTGSAPILFLRSFEDDQLSFRRGWWNLFHRWLDLWAFRRNVDELLIDEFAQFGPVVALGKPGETTHKFGAQRRFATHETWQDVIRDTAKRAQAIIVAAGETPGLLWEYNLIAGEDYLPKTLILIPPPRGDGSNVTRARDVLSSAFPDTDGLEGVPGRALVAFLRDEAGWRPISCRKATAQAYLVVIRDFMRTAGIVKDVSAPQPSGAGPHPSDP